MTAIHLGKAKTRDFFVHLTKNSHWPDKNIQKIQTGPTKWNQTMHLDGEAWKEIFKRESS